MTSLDEAARRKTKANTEVRRLTQLLTEAQEEFIAASVEFRLVKELNEVV